MTAVEHFAGFEELRMQRLMRMGPGVALHAMLFPARYPTEREAMAARINNRALPSVLEGYKPKAAALLAAGVVIQRLVVLHGPDDPGFDPPYVRLLQDECTQLQESEPPLEEAKVAWYGSFLSGMREACGGESPFVDAYIQGVKEDDPKASFWALYQSPHGTGWSAPELVGMQYYRDQKYAGTTVHVQPYSPALGDYVRHCRDTFDDPAKSTNVADLKW